ncbi:MAG: hypothetical protein QW753_05780 [Thermofilum sp.]
MYSPAGRKYIGVKCRKPERASAGAPVAMKGFLFPHLVQMLSLRYPTTMLASMIVILPATPMSPASTGLSWKTCQ